MTTGRKFRLPASAIVALSFFILILLGTAFLCIPAASADGNTHFFRALFTATSATCVTGLVVADTASSWSGFGQAVILLLIQMGGLGFITIISIFLFYVKKKTSLSQRKLVMQSAGSVELGGVKDLVKYILIGTFIFEFAGAFALSFSFVPRVGWGRGIWQAVFTSVSAFCNAGFTLTGNFASLTPYAADPNVNLVAVLLILVGGVGFFVWGDVVRHRHRIKDYSLHSKVVLTATLALVLAGWFLFALFEWNNASTIGGYDPATKIMASLFLSVTPRTAGFNTVDYGSMTSAGKVLTDVFMFIGGSPGSTAGGVKTTTVAVFFLSALATSKRYGETHVYRRRLEDDAPAQASAVIALYVVVIIVSVLAVSAIDVSQSSDAVVFEVISAVGTVGLSCDLTPQLHVASQVILIFLMFFGRVGGFTLILIFSNDRKPVPISRVADRLIIG